MHSVPDRGLAAIVLAAGAGTRLRPLTAVLPKPLCPVLDRPLLDHALDRVAAAEVATGIELPVAVNVHHGAEAIEAHLADRGVRISPERDEALGTAGAVGHLRGWLRGRGALVVNGDTYTTVSLAPLLEGWDGERVRVLVPGAPGFGPTARLVGTLLPWRVVEGLAATPSGLWEVVLREGLDDGSLEVVGAPGEAIDCGTPADYLRANLAALSSTGARCWVGEGAIVDGSAEDSVIGAGAVVDGDLQRCVVWPGATVVAGEHLTDAVRVRGRGPVRTVLVR